jgi:hypothetical protein
MTKTKEIEDIIEGYQYLFDDGLVIYSQTKYTWNFTIKHQRDFASKYSKWWMRNAFIKKIEEIGFKSVMFTVGDYELIKKNVHESDNLIPRSKVDEIYLTGLPFWAVKTNVDDNDMVDIDKVISSLMCHIVELETGISKLKNLHI